MKIKVLLILTTFMVLTISVARIPTPFCDPKPSFKSAPISPG